MPCDNNFAVSPNPAINEITVSQIKNKNVNTGTIDEIKVYDLQGMVRKYQKFNKAKQVHINISELNNGSYYIEISSGAFKERHQLIIQK